MSHWLADLQSRLRLQPVVIRVVVAQALGSAPREAGAVMLVDREGVVGTIGGGELEWRSLALARDMLNSQGPAVRLVRWPLGPELGQCCGGAVSVWFERIDRSDDALLGELASRLRAGESGWLISAAELRPDPRHGPHNRVATTPSERRWSAIAPGSMAPNTLVERLGDTWPSVWLFGAGHVGRALAHVIETLPFPLTVVDARESALAALPPGRARRVRGADPVVLVADIPAGAVVLVMTHSHDSDYAIVRAALNRDDLAWVGVIGSDTKATCFRLRLGRDGVDDQRISSLVSPIGIEGIRSKRPEAIAVAVSAQLLTRRAATEPLAYLAQPAPDRLHTGPVVGIIGASPSDAEQQETAHGP